MRNCLLLAGLLLPLLGWAQKWQPGTYTLAGNRTVPHKALVKLVKGTKLKVKGEDGKVEEFTPLDIYSLRMGAHKFRTVNELTIDRPGRDLDTEGGFVEQVDSGRVTLFRFSYTVDNFSLVPVGASSNTVVFPTRGPGEYYYFLQRPTDTAPVALPSKFYGGAGQEFYATLLPFLTGRPDLAQLVEQKRVTIIHIPGLIHALNTGEAYTPTKYH